jgi:hypothetical protein
MRLEIGVRMYDSSFYDGEINSSRTRLSKAVKVVSSCREKDANILPNLAMATPNAFSTTISPLAVNRAISFRLSSLSTVDFTKPSSISRADLADFMVEACESTTWGGKAVLLGG